MLLDDDFLARWEQIVNDVDKDHLPIECVKKIIFRIANKRQKTINLSTLRKQSVDDDAINQAIENFIRDNEDEIHSMELIVDVKAVAEIIQPETDKLLKGM
jgi:Asp-tRNA(Asn)/Glu-tRNA(Gln) amidotransferase B subunit